MSTTTKGSLILDGDLLEARGKLIELAAFFDRLKRLPNSTAGDPRKEKIIQAFKILASDTSAYVERIQELFSLPYEENWRG
jgi:hypothetical protein